MLKWEVYLSVMVVVVCMTVDESLGSRHYFCSLTF